MYPIQNYIIQSLKTGQLEIREVEAAQDQK